MPQGDVYNPRDPADLFELELRREEHGLFGHVLVNISDKYEVPLHIAGHIFGFEPEAALALAEAITQTARKAQEMRDNHGT